MSTTDTILRGDPDAKYKAVTARVAPSVDPDAAIDVACFMSTDSVDADDEVLLPEGVDLSRYERNPVVLLCHAYGQPGSYYPLPVGKSEWIKKRPRGVLAGVRFTVKTLMGREVKALFDDDMLRSFSVGFRPIEASLMTHDEAQSRPDWRAAFERTRGRVMVHRRWHLLELSVAPVPSNPDALVTQFKAKGLAPPSWLQLTPTPSETSPMGEIDTKCAMGGFAPGQHARHTKSGACGEVKSVDGDDVTMDLHDKACAPTGTMKSYGCKELTAYGDGDGDEDDGMKTAKAGKPEPDAEPEAETSEASEDMEEDGEDASAAGFRKGHHVTIKAPHYHGKGVVVSIHRKGHVPDVPQDVMGTRDEPAARIRAYKAMGDGHTPTGDYLGAHCKHLTHLPEEMRAPSKPKAVVPKTKSGEPLPPLVPLTPEQEIEAALTQLTPASIGSRLAAELDRRSGVI